MAKKLMIIFLGFVLVFVGIGLLTIDYLYVSDNEVKRYVKEKYALDVAVIDTIEMDFSRPNMGWYKQFIVQKEEGTKFTVYVRTGYVSLSGVEAEKIESDNYEAYVVKRELEHKETYNAFMKSVLNLGFEDVVFYDEEVLSLEVTLPKHIEAEEWINWEELRPSLYTLTKSAQLFGEGKINQIVVSSEFKKHDYQQHVDIVLDKDYATEIEFLKAFHFRNYAIQKWVEQRDREKINEFFGELINLLWDYGRDYSNVDISLTCEVLTTLQTCDQYKFSYKPQYTKEEAGERLVKAMVQFLIDTSFPIGSVTIEGEGADYSVKEIQNHHP